MRLIYSNRNTKKRLAATIQLAALLVKGKTIFMAGNKDPFPYLKLLKSELHMNASASPIIHKKKLTGFKFKMIA